jgi:LmbE family N-acetylglucosaminyl deacetylase
MIFISPHFDDAVLSCGEWIDQESTAYVLTILGGVPRTEIVTDYDVRSGWKNSTDAMIGRMKENARACMLLATPNDEWEFCDSQYGVQPEPGVLEDMLQQQVFSTRETVVAPLGLAHRDHIKISDAVLVVAKAIPEVTLWLYEELPRRVHEPQEVVARLADLRDDGWRLEYEPRVRGNVERKEIALRCYRSQEWALDWRSALVPERYWRAQWTG